ncbi:MAG: OmpA family protein [Bradymonadaceae bacterium]
MSRVHQRVVCVFAIALLMGFSATAFAEGAEEEQGVEEAASEEASEADADTRGERVAAVVAERNEGSEHGSRQWKPSWGFGLEAGYFFTDLDRWNEYILARNGMPTFDTMGVWNFDLVAEASLIEFTRLSLFGGIGTPFSSDPQLSAWYIGLEPALAFRGGSWELALGLGAAVGNAQVSGDDDRSFDAMFYLLRPFLEGRYYVSESFATYARVGFSSWLAREPRSDTLDLTQDDGRPIEAQSLNEGGVYLAVGFRFGSYPEHVRYIGDSDGDGFYDDVDACAGIADNFAGPEADWDGCPNLDIDGDGVLNVDDHCPHEAVVFIDGFEDHHGCPNLDVDGDGVLNVEDECPLVPTNFNGHFDETGCPILDRDGDGIVDTEDLCPDVPGVPERQGCPFQRVEVTLKNIVINDRVHFEYDKAVIKEESHDLLNEVAQVINDNERIRKIEVQGHTDHQGSHRYNMNLSENRAKAVREYLVAQGVDEERLTSKGFGFTVPIVALPEDGTETEEAAAQNRRVEFLILEQDEVRKVVREDEVPDDAGEVRVVDDEAENEAVTEDDGEDQSEE